MGLDMYLKGKVFVGAEYAHRNVTGSVNIKVANNKIKLPPFTLLSSLEYNMAYWRKANAIHKWFVDNVQEGVDDCKAYYVDIDQLQELVYLCNEVNIVLAKCETNSNGDYVLDALSEKDKAILEQLPPQKGFFFGDAEINVRYKEDLDSTISQLSNIISKSYPDISYYYQSSW